VFFKVIRRLGLSQEKLHFNLNEEESAITNLCSVRTINLLLLTTFPFLVIRPLCTISSFSRKKVACPYHFPCSRNVSKLLEKRIGVDFGVMDIGINLGREDDGGVVGGVEGEEDNEEYGEVEDKDGDGQMEDKDGDEDKPDIGGEDAGDGHKPEDKDVDLSKVDTNGEG